MQHIKTFESFVNQIQTEELNETYMVQSTESSLMIVSTDKNSHEEPVKYMLIDKGIAEVYAGSHGEESRIVSGCKGVDKEGAIKAFKTVGSTLGSKKFASHKEATEMVKKALKAACN